MSTRPQRKPSIDPDVEPKVIKMRSKSWDPDSTIEMTLRQRLHSDREWEVYTADGTWIGTVGRSIGTLDTPIARGSRIVHRGKKRTLWHNRSTWVDARTVFEQVSRADAIRWLLPR